MKRITSIILLICLTLGLSSCGKESRAILDNSDKSYFVDFYTEGEKVCIECVLNVYNPDAKDKKVRITAIDNEDVDSGLLKTPMLTAVSKENNSDTFTLKPGENELKVIFTGDYAGIYQINARELPRFIQIENA